MQFLNKIELENFIAKSTIIFFDFDGVIKESAEIKEMSYVSLFSSFGEEFQARVSRANKRYSGLDRYERIKMYLNWLNMEPSVEVIQQYAHSYHNLVIDEVLQCPWVPGVIELLKKYHRNKKCLIISATPHDELDYIVNALNIRKYFLRNYGSPKKKLDAMNEIMIEFSVHPNECIFFGDSSSDYLSAKICGVPFVLRVSAASSNMNDYAGPAIIDFTLN